MNSCRGASLFSSCRVVGFSDVYYTSSHSFAEEPTTCTIERDSLVSQPYLLSALAFSLSLYTALFSHSTGLLMKCCLLPHGHLARQGQVLGCAALTPQTAWATRTPVDTWTLESVDKKLRNNLGLLERRASKEREKDFKNSTIIVPKNGTKGLCKNTYFVYSHAFRDTSNAKAAHEWDPWRSFSYPRTKLEMSKCWTRLACCSYGWMMKPPGVLEVSCDNMRWPSRVLVPSKKLKIDQHVGLRYWSGS